MKTQELMISTRDGVRLQTFIYLPTGEGPFAALMARCMYGTDKLKNDAHFWTEQGYAVVLQNVRGRHQSEGRLADSNSFPEDGYDTLQWIQNQPWCSRRIGTFGRSALAEVQTATAFLSHPAHCAMAPQALPYDMNSRLGGAYMFSQIPQWFYWAQSGPELNSYDKVDWMPLLHQLPITSVLDEIGGPIELYHKKLASLSGKIKSNVQTPEKFKALNTPNLMVTGWHDHCATGAVDFFLNTMQYGSEVQKCNTHLIIGPWDHTVNGDAAGEYDFGPQANLDQRIMEAAFFDHHLRDKTVKPLAPVKIFVMGSNRWRDEKEWPPERSVPTKVYLHSDGNVRGAWQRGYLSITPPKDEKPDHFTYDPADPVPTVGGANSGPAITLPMLRGARDQRITLYRSDVLTFFSTPFKKPMEVTGMLKLVLYAKSSAEDTDFTAKLMDVAKDGNARLLSDGVVRARFRDDRQTPSKLVPHKIYRYEIDLWFTSNEFQSGHCLALALSSSNFPRFNRNLNTFGNNEQETHFISARQTIFHDKDHPSHLVLPVIRES